MFFKLLIFVFQGISFYFPLEYFLNWNASLQVSQFLTQLKFTNFTIKAKAQNHQMMHLLYSWFYIKNKGMQDTLRDKRIIINNKWRHVLDNILEFSIMNRSNNFYIE